MPALVDARPPGVDAWFRPGNEFTLTLHYPAGSLTGRTFSATLDAAALTVQVVEASDLVTVTASAAQTAAVTDTATFVYSETTGTDQVVLVGKWAPSLGAGATTGLDVTVVQDGGSVQVSFPSVPTAVGGGFTIAGDTTIAGEILTGTFGSPPTFGGIEREARFFPSGSMVAPGCPMNVGDGFPRVLFADDKVSTGWWIFEVEEWWLVSTIGVYMEWVNDHSSTGNVRFRFRIRECDIATETVASAGLVIDRTVTVATPAAGVSTTTVIASVASGFPCGFNPGTFASFYSLEVARLGDDAADTLNGPIGIIAGNMTRGQ